jgi:hypothetical protein
MQRAKMPESRVFPFVSNPFYGMANPQCLDRHSRSDIADWCTPRAASL